jgi:hypothetical protein
MSFSFNKIPGRPRVLRAPAAILPALRGGFFRVYLTGCLGFFSANAMAGPTPINTEFADQQILLTLPEPALATTAPPSDPDQLADLLQKQIQQARRTGDPRFFGYAEGLLNQWKAPLTDRLRVLKATIDQSNHRFEQARDALQDIINTSSSRQQALQALLILANINLVQGDYQAAARHCDLLASRMPGLIASSCQAQVRARTGQPKAAYQSLQTELARASTGDTSARLWAEGTLGDIAAQMGDPAAEVHWRNVLAVAPDDLYIRTQLADWHLDRQAPEQALTLTADYEQVDSLAVLRAIAMKRAGDPGADPLAEALKQRFSEAQWRGNLLHKREFARFQLDIEGDAQQALATAEANWTDQREPADTRLLLRAAIAAGDGNQASAVRKWLSRTGQEDARFPGAEL